MICPKCQFENPPGSGFCNRCGTQISPSTDIPYSKTETVQQPKEELTIGSTFAGRYQIIEELGKGGMGNVYKVLDKELGEKVALKLLKPEIAADHRIIERFRNEIKFARKITHKNVCRMFDLSKAERAPYITMEYVSGEDLKSTLRRVGPLSEGKAIYIARQVCEGLIEAHKLGVVHRDLKPQNIMIDKQGHPRIMDFGIARSMKGEGITTSGMMIGTPEYMSPEQVEGKEADQRADIYAMGVILYEMVTGTTPFKGDTALSVAIKHTREKPRNPREINDRISIELSRLILKCLEKDRFKRYQSVQELLDVLNRIAEGFPTTDKVLPDRPSTSRAFQGKPGLKKALIAVFAVLALIIAAVLAWRFTSLPEIFRASASPPEAPSIEDHLNAANQLWKEKDYSKAYDQFKKVLDLDSRNLDAQFGLANSLRAQGKPDESIPEYEKAIAIDEKDHRAYGQLGLIYEQKQEWSKALDYYKKYLSTAPQGQDFALVSQKVINIQEQMEPVAAKPEPRPEAPQEAKAAPPSKKIPVKKAEAEPEAAKPEEKITEKKKPEEKKPDISGRLNEGVNALSRGDFDTCIRLMEEVLKLDPGNSSARFFLAEAKKRKEENQKEQQVNRMLKSAQDAYNDGNYQECIKQAEGVLEIDPENASALNLISEAKKKAEENRKEQQVKDGLSQAQESFDQKKYQECIDQAKRVLSIDPENAQARRLITQARIRLAPQQAQLLVNQYIQSLNSKNLLAFYERACSPEEYQRLKNQAQAIMATYQNLQATASDINIQFQGVDEAKISFSHIITGTSKDGIRENLFEGVINWGLTREDDGWKITSVNAVPKGKK